jgi:hypothetical protein
MAELKIEFVDGGDEVLRTEVVDIPKGWSHEGTYYMTHEVGIEFQGAGKRRGVRNEPNGIQIVEGTKDVQQVHILAARDAYWRCRLYIDGKEVG